MIHPIYTKAAPALKGCLGQVPVSDAMKEDLIKMLKELSGYSLRRYYFEATYSSNYFSVELKNWRTQNKEVILFQDKYPVFAGVAPSTWDHLNFFELDEKLVYAIESLGFFYVPRESAELPIQPGDVDRFSNFMKREVAYWKPLNIGNIIFNNWD